MGSVNPYSSRVWRAAKKLGGSEMLGDDVIEIEAGDGVGDGGVGDGVEHSVVRRDSASARELVSMDNSDFNEQMADSESIACVVVDCKSSSSSAWRSFVASSRLSSSVRSINRAPSKSDNCCNFEDVV